MARNRSSAVANLKSDEGVISSFDYAHDKAGNRTRVAEDTGDRVTWTYRGFAATKESGTTALCPLNREQRDARVSQTA